MIIPITIGYDGNKKIVEDLVDLAHLLVYISKEQMDVIENRKEFICEKLRNDNYDICPIYFSLRDRTNMCRMFEVIKYRYKTMEDRYDLFTKEKCRNISEYNDTHEEKLKHKVLLLYGYPNSEYLGHKKIEDRLTRILQLGRAAGIHIIIITDEIENMCDGVLLNFVNKVCTRKDIDKEMFYLSNNLELHENELVYDCAKNDKPVVLHYKKEDYTEN